MYEFEVTPVLWWVGPIFSTWAFFLEKRLFIMLV
jgi:hypothetical protein